MHTSLKLSSFNKSGCSGLRLVSRLTHSDSSVTLSSDDHQRFSRMAEVDPEAEYSPTHSPAAKAVARANRIRLSLQHPASCELGDVEIAKLMNGMTVASVPTEFPAYHVQLAVKAGPRFEDAGSIGVSHVVRRMFGLASKPFRFAVNQNRTLQQIGASVECKGGRESTMYQLSQYKFADEAIDIAATAFAFASTMPAFYPWEISRNMPMLRRDLADIRGSTELLLEQLHSVAYKGGLGNSLFCPEYRLGEINADVVEDFYNKHFTPDRFALVGVGLPLGTLKDLAHKFCFLEPKQPSEFASRWLGGESRVANGNPCVRVAIAVEGASAGDAAGSAAQSVAGAALTANPGSSPICSAAESAAVNGPVAVSALNLQYSDSGLFGLHIVCDYRDAGGVIRACLDKLKEAADKGIPQASFASGKASLALQSAESQLQPHNRLCELSNHLLLGSSLDTPAAVEKVTIEQANAQLKKLIGAGKRTAVASLGRLDNVPYRDELQL